MSSNDESDNSSICGIVKCSYCSKEQTLVAGKNYCFDCKARCYKECKRCHLPFHDKKFYSFSEYRCNSCHKKYLKEKQKREERKRKIESERTQDEDDDTLVIKEDKKKYKKNKCTSEGEDTVIIKEDKMKNKKSMCDNTMQQKKVIGYLAVYNTKDLA